MITTTTASVDARRFDGAWLPAVEIASTSADGGASSAWNGATSSAAMLVRAPDGSIGVHASGAL